MSTSFVSFDELEERLDAEFYSPQYIQKRRDLESSTLLIEDLTNLLQDLTDGAHQTPTYVKEGVRFLSSGNIHELRLDLEDTKCISEEAHQDLARTQVEPGDVLVSKSGRIGTAAVAPETLGECNLYEGVALLRPNDKIDSYYLAAFLNSIYGRFQIDRSIKGVSQPHLHLEEIEKIQIPIPDSEFQTHIRGQILAAQEKWHRADLALKDSSDKLMNILGLDFEFDRHRTYQTPFSNLSDSIRLDPEFYQPLYREMLETSERSGYEIERLDSNTQVALSNEKVDPAKNPTNEFRYITIGHIDKSTGRISDHDEVLGHEAPGRARMRIEEGDILVPYLSGSMESVALVPEEYNGAVATTGFYVIRPRKAISEFVFALMRSSIIQSQIAQRTSGAVMTSINKSDFKRIQFPILPQEIQKNVGGSVAKSIELRNTHDEIINDAKRKIVDLIPSN